MVDNKAADTPKQEGQDKANYVVFSDIFHFYVSISKNSALCTGLIIILYPTLSHLSIFIRTDVYNLIEVIVLKPLKEKISITIDSDVLDKIKAEAEEDDRSLSQYINIILKQHLKRNGDQSHT